MPRQFTVNADTLQAIDVDPSDLTEAADPEVLAQLQGVVEPMPSHDVGDYRSDNRRHWDAEIERLMGLRVAPIPMGGPAAAGPSGPAGAGLLGRAARGMKQVVTQAAPIIKYEAAKGGMEAMGVPSSVSVPVAIGVSGYSRTAPPTARSPRASRAKPAAAASSASPAASTPATPTPPAAPSAPATAPTASAGPKWSPQQIRNEVGLAAHRAKAKLSEAEYAKADELVAQGTSPAEAVAHAVAARGTAPAAAAAKVKLSAAEGKVYMQLRGKGKTHDEALKSIESQRTLAGKLGTPSSEEVRSKVAERNVTGRWPK